MIAAQWPKQKSYYYIHLEQDYEKNTQWKVLEKSAIYEMEIILFLNYMTCKDIYKFTPFYSHF